MKNPISLFIAILIISFPLISNGQIGWQWAVAGHETGPSDYTDFVGKIVTDKDGNIYETGINNFTDSSSFGSFGIKNRQLLCQTIVVKIDSSGHYLWAVGTSRGNSMPLDIVVDNEGNSYVLGSFYSVSLSFGTTTIYGDNSTTYFLAKISATGAIVWVKNMGRYSTTSIDYNAANDYWQVCKGGLGIDAYDNIYFAGTFKTDTLQIGTVSLPNINTAPDPLLETYIPNFFLAKLDTSGTARWIKRVVGDTSSGVENLISVAPDGSVFLQGNVFSSVPIAGITRSNASCLVRVDSSGNMLMAHGMANDLGDNYASVNAMKTDQYNNIYLAATVDTVVTIGSTNLPYQGLKDVVVIKYDSLGNELWAQSMGGSKDDIGYGLAVDSCQNVFVCGSMGPYYIIPRPEYTITVSGNILHPLSDSCCDPMFVAQFNDQGDYVRSIALITGGEEWSDITVDNRGDFYLGLDYWSYTSPWIIANDTLPPTWNNEFTGIAKYKYDIGSCGLTTQVNSSPTMEKNTLVLTPNPAISSLTVTFSSTIKQITMYNLLGKVVYANQCNSGTVQIDIANMLAGMYFIKVNGQEVRKFVKE